MAKVEKDGFTYFIMYDDEMNVVHSFFQYINFQMSHLSFNTREQTAYALRILYCYSALTKTDFSNLTKKDIINLQYFLLGYSPAKGPYSFQLKTLRNNKTVNNYIHIYRDYLRFIGIKCSCIENIRTANIQSLNSLGEREVKNIQRYELSLKESTPVNRVPKYISINDFSNILSIVRSEKNTEAEIIIRLMFEYGLRIGEVLGITNEDVTEKKIDGVLRPIIILRNRMSDNKKYQNCKTLLKVYKKEIYKSPNYKTQKIGYDLIYITDEFYEILNDYIECTLVTEKKKGNIEYSVADTVEKHKYAPDNHYIFLNNNGRPLSSKSWNNYLRKIYDQSGIYLDHNIRKHNLNHRFRHGFAMFQVKYRNTNVFELKEMMRHSSVSSTMIYYSLTEDDEYAMKMEFVEDLYSLIPSLKERPNIYGTKIN